MKNNLVPPSGEASVFLKYLQKMVIDFKNMRAPQTVKRAMRYLNKAKVDLESAKILYAKKKFDNSILLLQQSVEKAAKGLYIIYSNAPKKALKRIGHKEPLVFLNMFKEFSKKYIEPIKLLKPDWTPDFIDQLDKLSMQKLKFAQMNKEAIMKLMKIPRQILNSKSTIVAEIRSLTSRPGLAQAVRDITGEEIHLNDVLENVYSCYSLLILSYLTFPHAMSTRYPEELMDPTEYRKGLGIVDAAPKLFKELEKAIKIEQKMASSLGSIKTR